MWSLWLSKQKTPDPGSYRRHQMVFSLICAGISGWANSRYAGDLRRSCAHYDVTVMIMKSREKSFRITGSVSGKSMVNKGKLRRFLCQTIDCRLPAGVTVCLAAFAETQLRCRKRSCAQLGQLRAANAASAARALIRSTIGSMGPQKPNEQYIEHRWRSWRSQRSWCSWCSCTQPTQPAQPEL